MDRPKAQNNGTIKRLKNTRNSTKMQKIREYCCPQPTSHSPLPRDKAKVVFMRNFLAPRPVLQSVPAHVPSSSGPDSLSADKTPTQEHDYSPAELAIFSSDESDVDQDAGISCGDEANDEDDEDPDLEPRLTNSQPPQHCQNLLPTAPPPKRHRLEVLACVAHVEKKNQKVAEFKNALIEIKKKIDSKKTEFIGGPEGLQAH